MRVLPQGTAVHQSNVDDKTEMGDSTEDSPVLVHTSREGTIMYKEWNANTMSMTKNPVRQKQSGSSPADQWVASDNISVGMACAFCGTVVNPNKEHNCEQKSNAEKNQG